MTAFWKVLLSRIDYSSLPIKYVKLAECIEAEIDNGSLMPGDAFPSMEKIAIETRLNKKTVNKAIALLKSRNKVYSTDGAGVFVSNRKDDGELEPDYLPWFRDSKRSAFEEEHLGSFVSPFAMFDTQYLRVYGTNLPRHSKLDEVNTYGNLTKFLTSLLLHESCIRADPKNVWGVQERRATMNILLKVLYMGEQGTFVMTNPGCDIIGDTAKRAGFSVLTVGIDEEGMRTAELEELCKVEIPSVVYVEPRCHFPSTVMTRRQILSLLGRLLCRDSFLGTGYWV